MFSLAASTTLGFVFFGYVTIKDFPGAFFARATRQRRKKRTRDSLKFIVRAAEVV